MANVKRGIEKVGKKDINFGKDGKVVSENFDKKHPLVAEKINNSLNLSIREGGIASAHNGLSTSYFTPFALAVGSTSSQIGLLGALIGLLPGVAQWNSSKLVEKFSRKRIVLVSAIIQAILFLPIIAVGLLFYYGAYNVAWITIGLITLYYAFGAIGGPAWFSWMGSLVPETSRGKYFSKRNYVAGFFSLLTMVIGGLLLEYFREFGIVLIGFGILFFIAFLLRGISIILLAKQYEPKLKINKKDYFSFWQFLKRAPNTPFGRFTIFTTFLRVAVGIAAPFFAVYMLKDLGFSYFWFMAITVSGTLFQLLFLPLIGKFSDQFGNALLLKVSAFLMFTTPLLWAISNYIGLNDLYLRLFILFVPGIIGGFAWAGYNISVNNYVYDSVCDKKRSFGVTYLNLLAGIGIFVGGLIGSGLALLDFSFINTLVFIFIISGLARFGVILFGFKHLREVRHVERFKSQFIYKEINPVTGLRREVHNIMHSKRGAIKWV